MGEGVIVGRIGQGCVHNVGGGWILVLDARFAVAKCMELGTPRTCCQVSLLDSRPLIPRRSQLTSAVSLARYRILTPG